MNKTYTAIHYSQFEPLLNLTNNYKKAAFLDKIIYWYKTSTWTLPGSDTTEVWFTRTYEAMSKELKTPTSTLKGYMKEFTEAGYIERVRKKFHNNVHAFFRVTPNLFRLLGTTVDNNKPITSISSEPMTDIQPVQKNLAQTHTSRNLETGRAYNKDNYLKGNVNNITLCDFGGGITANPISEIPPEYQNVSQAIGERLQLRQKKFLIGAIENTISQNKISLSISKSELFAQMAYEILNKNMLKTAKTFSNRVNSVAKMLREGRWNTPWGFHKYFDVGRHFKAAQEKRFDEHYQRKMGEITACEKTPSTQRITLSQVEKPLYEQPSEGKNWQFEQKRKELEGQKGRIVAKINALLGESKQLQHSLSVSLATPTGSDNPAMKLLKKRTMKQMSAEYVAAKTEANMQEVECLKAQLEAISLELKELTAKMAELPDTEWLPLYETA